MQFFVGTSGYSYSPWKGSFYPEKLPARQMLSYYAERLSTVEINYTFRRAPTEKLLRGWAELVPADFRFVLKAPQRITQHKRLKDVDDDVANFLGTAKVLKRRLGAILIQLHPNFKKDLPRLKAFLKLLKRGTRAAFEFRHPSWFDDDIFAILRKKSCALCLADTDEAPCTELVSTADWGYVRLRRENYSDTQLRAWIKRFRAQPWSESNVFFRHEDTGAGPRMAARFIKLAGG